MIKGLNNTPKPFLTRVIIADDYLSNENKSQLELYGEYNEANNSDLVQTQNDYKLDLTLDFHIKAGFKQPLDFTLQNQLKNSLNASSLNTILIANKDSFLKFLSYSEKGKKQYLNSFVDPAFGFMGGKKLFNTAINVNDYISYEGDSPENILNQKVLNVPIQMNKKFSANIDKNIKNPKFLACIYFLTVGAGSIIPGTINSEIIFNDGSIVNKSGYFTIGQTYSYLGQEAKLTNAAQEVNKIFLDQIHGNSETTQSYLIDPDTGESLNSNIPTDRNKQTNYLFGAPGDVWVGPVHTHLISDESNPDFGKIRIMAAGNHDSSIPHPYLVYNITGNSKVIDFRSIGAIEDLFSYKSSAFEDILAGTSDITYTGEKNDFYVEDNIKKSPIFSELKYSIRPITIRSLDKDFKITGLKTKDNVVLLFSIDKRNLLKHTTKARDLLENLTSVDPLFYNSLTKDINIFHFEIIRKNITTGVSKSLITGDNDKEFNDDMAVNSLGIPISKGFSFVNVTDSLSVENGFDSDNISVYQFTDGEIDASVDNNTYSYEIKIKFKDPMIAYLTARLQELNEIIKDLDELFEKTGFMIKDTNTGKFVPVYDRFKKQLNTTFVNQCLSPPPKPILPLNFKFKADSELPESVDKYINFVITTQSAGLNNLTIYLLAIKLSPFNQMSKFSDFFTMKATELADFVVYVHSSLMLSSTTPTLIQKVISLMELTRDRTEKLLSLYSTEQIVKKSANFSTKDYLKSTGNTDNSQTFVIELDYNFGGGIDLSKTKNYFNWIEEAPHRGFSDQYASPSKGLKRIGTEAYISLVQNPNILDIMSEEGKAQFDQDELFSYSFLPYISPSTLEFEKSKEFKGPPILQNHLKTIRQKLIHNITNTPDSVLIPEILATFGIKFPSTTRTDNFIKEYFEDISIDEKFITINNIAEDNFASDFSPQPLVINFPGKPPAFGSVPDPNYDWQGGTYSDYPYNLALSLINLITTNVYERREMDYLHERYGIFAGSGIPDDFFFTTKDIPYAVNLFATNVMSDKETAGNIFPDLFSPSNADGSSAMAVGNNFRFSMYDYYSYLLNIFGKVHYFTGFNRRDDLSFGGDTSKFLPTTVANNHFIKDMNFAPLTLDVLNNIPPGKRILCKVMLHEGGEIKSPKPGISITDGGIMTDVLDQKVVDLYKDYYNYNHMFYIVPGGSPLSINPVDQIRRVEIPTPSAAREAREEITKEIREIGREAKRKRRKQDPKSQENDRKEERAGNEAIKEKREKYNQRENEKIAKKKEYYGK